MTVLKVPDMNCEHCVKRITQALKEAELNFKVSLGDKTVEIEGDEKAIQTAVAALDELGFTPEQK